MLVGEEHGIEAVEIGSKRLGPEVRAAVDDDPARTPGEEHRRPEAPVPWIVGRARLAVAGDPRNPGARPRPQDPDPQLARLGARVARIEPRLQAQRELVARGTPPSGRRVARRRIGRAGLGVGQARRALRSDPLPEPPDHDGRTAGRDPVERLVGQRVGGAVLRARHVAGAPAAEAAEAGGRLGVERDELGVLDPPAAPQLLHDQHRIEQERELVGPQLLGEGEGPQEPGVLGDVVGLAAERLRRRWRSAGRPAARRRGRRRRSGRHRTTPGRGCRAPPRRCGR